MASKKEISKKLKFTISCGGGDGACLCYTKVSKAIYDYFIKRDLNLEEYAIDEEYAEIKNIPEKMQPFNPGERASFGYYETGMTATNDLNLYVEDEKSNKIFDKKIPKSNITKDKTTSESFKYFEKGIYAIGYEGLEDCYITGTLNIKSSFDLKKFKIQFTHLDYDLGERELISSITYENEEVDWSLDSYEGTGDNSFGFIVVQ
jgi:hypothetical protein